MPPWTSEKLCDKGQEVSCSPETLLSASRRDRLERYVLEEFECE